MDAISPASRSPSPDYSPLAVGTGLTPLPAYKAAGTISLDFDGLLDAGTNALKLHEDLSSGCGGQTWPAGIVLAKHMLRYHGERLRTARMCVSLHLCLTKLHCLAFLRVSPHSATAPRWT